MTVERLAGKGGISLHGVDVDTAGRRNEARRFREVELLSVVRVLLDREHGLRSNSSVNAPADFHSGNTGGGGDTDDLALGVRLLGVDHTERITNEPIPSKSGRCAYRVEDLGLVGSNSLFEATGITFDVEPLDISVLSLE